MLTHSIIKYFGKIKLVLLQAREQQRSLELQEKLLDYGLSLEKVLNQSRDQATLAISNMRDTIIRQQQLLSGVSDSVDALRSWLLGEISWFDSLVCLTLSQIFQI